MSENKLNNYARLYTNLADAGLGAEALYASDDFFAPKERLLQPTEPVWLEGKYDEHGKWMDGWESRRKRGEGHDYCIVRLAAPGNIRAIDINTCYFTGNFPPQASVDACAQESVPTSDTEWTRIIPPSPLSGDSHNIFEIAGHDRWTHLRLNIFPDGGVARLRVFGEVLPDWRAIDTSGALELSAVHLGGRTLACSDEHYGAMKNLLKPGRGVDMGDGWETRRRRTPGYDWVILKLGHKGVIEKIEIDTAHFKGNFPHQVSVNAACMQDDCDDSIVPQSIYWKELLGMQFLEMDKQHIFEKEINAIGPVTHLRVNIHPDGGLSRTRFFGRIAPA